MVERIDREEGALRAKEEMMRAEEELLAASVLQKECLYFKSVASAYYSIYHAAKALLLIKGVDPKSHEGVERMFSLYYVKTGEFDLIAGKTIGRLMKMREEADYYPEVPFTLEESHESIKMALVFTDKAKALIPV